jgi:hypothetical protein
MCGFAHGVDVVWARDGVLGVWRWMEVMEGVDAQNTDTDTNDALQLQVGDGGACRCRWRGSGGQSMEGACRKYTSSSTSMVQG